MLRWANKVRYVWFSLIAAEKMLGWFIAQFIWSHTNLDHNSLYVSSVHIIPQHYTPCNTTSYHQYYSLLTVNLTKNYAIFLNCGLILTLYNCNCILVPTTLKIATWVAETCQWLLCNKMTFIHPTTIVDLFFFLIWLMHLMHGTWNMEHIKGWDSSVK